LSDLTAGVSNAALTVGSHGGLGNGAVWSGVSTGSHCTAGRATTRTFIAGAWRNRSTTAGSGAAAAGGGALTPATAERAVANEMPNCETLVDRSSSVGPPDSPPTTLSNSAWQPAERGGVAGHRRGRGLGR